MERAILHCDLNNFYASVECIKNSEYKNVPLAVTGNPKKRTGIILAKNYVGLKNLYIIIINSAKGRRWYNGQQQKFKPNCLWTAEADDSQWRAKAGTGFQHQRDDGASAY